MELLKSLHNLPHDLLEQIVEKSLLALNSKKDRSTSDDQQFVHEQMCRVLQSYGEARLFPLMIVKRQKYYAQFKEHVKNLLIFVDASLKPENRVERSRAVYLVLSVLAGFLKDAGVPVSYRTLVLNLAKICEVIDQQFPGYRESGLLHMVLTRKFG